MPTSTRGETINSWWQNRAALRRDTRDIVARLEEIQEELLQAAGNAEAPAITPPPEDESAGDLIQEANTTLAALKKAERQMAKLEAPVDEAAGELGAMIARFKEAARKRAAAKAQEAARKATEAQERAGRQQILMRKIGAVLLFFAVLFVLFKFF